MSDMAYRVSRYSERARYGSSPTGLKRSFDKLFSRLETPTEEIWKLLPSSVLSERVTEDGLLWGFCFLKLPQYYRENVHIAMHFPASGGMPWAIVQGMDKEEAEEMKSQLQGEPVDLLFCLCAVLSGFVVKDSRAIKECVDSVNNLGTIFRHPSDEYRASYSDVSKELSVTMARLKTIEAGTKYILDVCNHVLRIVGPEKIDEFFACKLLKNAATAHLYDNESIQAVIDIDLRVVYNIISQQNNRINISIARAARRDSSSMKIIALLTMLFLPGTYISSLFAMPLFDWTAMKGESVIKPRFKIYLIITIPLTTLLFAFWGLHAYRSKRKAYARDQETGEYILDNDKIKTK
ncbi:hypothetical protein V6Z79_008341 [Aspergillus fumigatus]